MSKKEMLLREIEHLPEPIIDDIFDFVNFLKAQISRQGNETAIASESSLKKDWLKPEEDEAWQDL